TFRYEQHLMVEHQRPAGMRAVFRYDGLGRCTETWCDHRGDRDPSLDETVSEFLADGRTPAKGFLHCVIAYFDDGYVEVMDSVRLRRLGINAAGKIDQASVGGAVFSHTYDAHGHETTYTDPLGA